MMVTDETTRMKKVGNRPRLNVPQQFTMLAFALIAGSFVGWCYEVFICGPLNGEGINWSHGGIGLPFLQIYGVGAVAIELALGLNRKEIPWYVQFLLACLLTGALEYAAGLLMMYGAHIQTWDYRKPGWDFLCTPDGLLCFRGVVTFGLMALLLLRVGDPWAAKVKLRHERVFTIVVWLLVLLLLAAVLNAYVLHWIPVGETWSMQV